jgi:AraC family transcriptional regulator
MIPYRLVDLPAFEIAGKKTWIAGVGDNAAFGRFWDRCRSEGLFSVFESLTGLQPGAHTHGVTLGVSRVEKDPARREFYYMIAVEHPTSPTPDGLESFMVPASLWAVFECRGPLPDAIVKSEIYAFTQWLPASGYHHALAPEMEVYPPASGPDDEPYCEFWLPIVDDN